MNNEDLERLKIELSDTEKFLHMFQTIVDGYKRRTEWLKNQIQKGESYARSNQ